MKVIFTLSEEFMNAEFARTGKQIASKIEGEANVTVQQAIKLVGFNLYYIKTEIGSVSDFSHKFYASTLDVSEALQQFIEHTEQENAKQQQRDAAREAERKERQIAREKKQEENRDKYLNNENAALEANVSSYNRDEFDEETYNYILLCKKRESERKETQRKAGKEKLKTWAMSHGSELLKARIEEEMNWHNLANDEYFKSILPADAQYLVKPSESWSIKDASLSQIQALRDFKRKNASIEAMLKRYKYTSEDEEYAAHTDVIAFDLESLSGEKRTFEILLNSDEK